MDEEHQLISQAILEVNKDEYEPFDDYLEIVTNFGYLVMLSAVNQLLLSVSLLLLFSSSLLIALSPYKINIRLFIFSRENCPQSMLEWAIGTILCFSFLTQLL